VVVGSNQEIDAWRGPNTRVQEAAGKRLLPGFNDAHVHFTSGGQQLDNVQLNDVSSPQEFARRVAERAKKTTKGEWILGGDWDETKWTPAQLPTKELIDSVTLQTPTALDRYDGHMILANSIALKLAGITAKTPDPLDDYVDAVSKALALPANAPGPLPTALDHACSCRSLSGFAALARVMAG